MPIRLTVRRGDSLWSLAHRYLGSGERYPQIYNFHNQEATRYGLRPIEKPNLIFVGQTILIPPRPKVPKPGSGTKAGGSHWPIPLNLKVTYTIGKDTPPIIYTASYGDYSIKTEMSGEIGIENKTPGDFKYVHNYELAMSKDSMQAKQKLRDTTDPALVALTAKPEMMFDLESGQLKIKAPISTEANLGPYTFRVQTDGPNHMSGTFTPPTISGTLELGRSKYKYSADIKFKVDVYLHPSPKSLQNSPVRQTGHQDKPAIKADRGIDWSKVGEFADELFAMVTITLLTILNPAIRMSNATVSVVPFQHSIDPRRHGALPEA